jgi:hypothetical protein
MINFLAGMVVFFAALMGFFVALTLILRKTGGYAPGWQVRCTSCGWTRPAAEAGIVRVGAASRGKWTLGWCRNCRKLRWIAIERQPENR